MLLERVAEVVDVPAPRIRKRARHLRRRRARSPACAGTARRTSRSRSPSDVKKAVALRILEQPEDFPGVLAEQQSVRAYPQPYGINLAHVLGYLSPITEDESTRPRRTTTPRSTAPPSVGRAGIEKEYDRWLRGMPGYKSVAVDSMGRVLGDDGEVAGQPGDTLVTSIDAKVQGIVEQQLARHHHDRARRPTTRSPTRTTSPTPARPS